MRRIMPRLLALCLSLLAVCPAARGEGATIAPLPEELSPSAACQVTVNGESLPLMDTAVNSSRVWEANPPLETAPVGVFAMNGPVNITVRFPGVRVESAVVRPLSLGVVPVILDNEISFTLPAPADLTVEYNGGQTGAVHLFAHNAAEPVPDPADPDVIYFGPGLHNANQISVRSGQTVYLAAGAVVRGWIRGARVKNVTICGPGILDGSAYDRWQHEIVPINLTYSQNIKLQGVTILDPAAWTVNLYHCQDVTLDGVRIISARSNGDGVSVQSCQNVSVKNCFVRAWDDCLVVKGYDGQADNIRFENCVLWSDLAQCCEIGYETRALTMTNIVFSHITVLHANHKPVISIHNSDGAAVSNVTFEHITVEDCQLGQGDGTNWLIDVSTAKSQWTKQRTGGTVRNVTIADVRVLAGKTPGIHMESLTENAVDGVHISGLRLMGREIASPEEAGLVLEGPCGPDITVNK